MTHARSLALFATLAACSSSSTSTPKADAAAAADAAHSIDAAKTPDASTASHLVLKVPGGYSGSPRQLAVVGAKNVPISGPPDSVFLLDNMPMPHAGMSMNLSLDTSTATGSLYVVVVLYQQGGGQYSPKSGVDYVAQSASTFNFTGAPMDLGSLDLVIAP